MPVQNYRPSRFNELEMFHVAEPKVAENEGAIWLLGEIICNYELEEEFGISFLHKHFEIDSSERLVRRYDNRTGTIEPEAPTDDHTGCIWGFEKGAQDECLPLEFCDRNNLPQSEHQSNILSKRKDFVRSCGTVIKEYGVENLFGIASLHGFQYLDPMAGEIILERSGGKSRSLELSIVSEQYLEKIDSSPTLWMFNNEKFEGAIECPIVSLDDAAKNRCHVAHCEH